MSDSIIDTSNKKILVYLEELLLLPIWALFLLLLLLEVHCFKWNFFIKLLYKYKYIHVHIYACI